MNICENVIAILLNTKITISPPAFSYIGPLDLILGSKDILQWLSQEGLIKQRVFILPFHLHILFQEQPSPNL